MPECPVCSEEMTLPQVDQLANPSIDVLLCKHHSAKLNDILRGDFK